MKASIVVPAYNAAGTIGECVAALRAQSFPAAEFELIVVDDGSSDATPEIARARGARVVQQRNAGAGAARNAGWRAATGKWVAFTDADCLPARTWLRSLVEACERRDAVGAAGKTIGFKPRSQAARFAELDGALDAERHLALG
jgi:glycosyltransferase involved in cell wall biosynthesis